MSANRIRECVGCHETRFIHAKSKCNTCYCVEKRRKERLARAGNCAKCDKPHTSVPKNKLHWCGPCYGEFCKTPEYRKLHRQTEFSKGECQRCKRERFIKCKQLCHSCYRTNRIQTDPKAKAKLLSYARVYNVCRYTSERQAAPPWVSKTELTNIYASCPSDKTVDHRVPLVHPDVCGLHVPWNLQYLTQSENSSKGNSFNPDDFRIKS